MHEMLAPHVANRPDKAAFRFEGRELSFAALDDQSTRLAARLQQGGLGKSDRVGLFLHRGLETPVGIFATFKAGGAFVPLDPFSPVERIVHLIQETEMQFIVTHAALAQKMAAITALVDHSVTVIGLDTPVPGARDTVTWEDAIRFDGSLTPVGLVDDDLAYIIFTSGSTGMPKGIMHSHRSGLAFSIKCQEMLELREDDRMGALAALIFDMSLDEYFVGPFAGATVVIAPEGSVRFPASLARFLHDERITVYGSVPSLLIRLLETDLSQVDLSAVRWILTGGEPMAPRKLTEAFGIMPNARYGNFYGPAETNVCIWHVISPGEEVGLATLPIGKATPGSALQIVDQGLEPVVEGEIGEVILRSGSTMLGYWRNAEKSDAAFHETTGLGGQREIWLRTGDQVHRRPDGVLEYHGRGDRQIKTRGYRVELDEVEGALAALDGVAEAGAIVYESGTGDKLIAAGVMAEPGCSLTEPSLTKSLKASLPPYAVPTELRILSEFPRTPSGKIARNKLIDFLIP